MTTPNQDPNNANPNPGSDPQNPPTETIALSKDEYAKLLAENAQLKAQSTPKPSADPAKPAKPLEQMNAAELYDFIQKNDNKPITDTLMQLAVKMELQEVSAKYTDFKEGRDDIFKLCQENPHLSLEQGYLLWKGQGSLKAPKAENKNDPDPKKENPPPVHKPGGGPNPEQIQPGAGLSTRDAALKAAKELGIE